MLTLSRSRKSCFLIMPLAIVFVFFVSTPSHAGILKTMKQKIFSSADAEISNVIPLDDPDTEVDESKDQHIVILESSPETIDLSKGQPGPTGAYELVLTLFNFAQKHKLMFIAELDGNPDKIIVKQLVPVSKDPSNNIFKVYFNNPSFTAAKYKVYDSTLPIGDTATKIASYLTVITEAQAPIVEKIVIKKMYPEGVIDLEANPPDASGNSKLSFELGNVIPEHKVQLMGVADGTDSVIIKKLYKDPLTGLYDVYLNLQYVKEKIEFKLYDPSPELMPISNTASEKIVMAVKPPDPVDPGPGPVDMKIKILGQSHEVFDPNVEPKNENGFYQVTFDLDNVQNPNNINLVGMVNNNEDELLYKNLVHLGGNSFALYFKLVNATLSFKMYDGTKATIGETSTNTAYLIIKPLEDSQTGDGTQESSDLLVDMDIERAYPSDQSDFASSQELLTFSIPIGQSKNIRFEDKGAHYPRALLGLAGNKVKAYQVSTILPYQPYEEHATILGTPGEEYTKWAIVHALVDHDGSEENNAFSIATGPGKSAGSIDICSVVDGTIVAHTGKLVAFVKGANFRGLERVEVNVNDNLIEVVNANAASSELGVVMKYKGNNTIYSSQYDAGSKAEIMFNGPVYCQVYVQGALRDSTGKHSGMDYATVLEFIKDKDYIKEETAFQNDEQFPDGIETRLDREFDFAQFNIAMSPAVKPDTAAFSSYLSDNNLVSASLAGVDAAFAVTGRTEFEKQHGDGYHPELNGFSGYRVGTVASGTTAYLQEGTQTTHYPKHMVMIASNSANDFYVALGETYHQYDWSKGQAIRNGIVSVETFPRYVPAANKSYSIRWRNWEVNTPSVIQFGKIATGKTPADYAQALKPVVDQNMFPLRSFPRNFNYYSQETAGLINGNHQQSAFDPLNPVSVEDQLALNDKLEAMYGMSIDDSKIVTTNSSINWYRHIQSQKPGGGPTNRNEINLPLFYNRAGAYAQYPGGRDLTEYSIARHRMEKAVPYLANEHCKEYAPNEWNMNNNKKLTATNAGAVDVTANAFFEQEHSWADVTWYTFLQTGNPLFMEAWDYSAEHCECAWYLNDANFAQTRAAGMCMYVLAQHYQTRYDQSSLDQIIESLTENLNKQSKVQMGSYSDSIKLTTGWPNPPGKDLDLEYLESISDPVAWASVNLNTIPLRGNWPGTGWTSGCGVSQPKDEVRGWMINHRLVNGMSHAWTVLPQGELRVTLEKRLVDLAHQANNDNIHDILYIDYNDPSKSGYQYSYCFSNAPFYSTGSFNKLVDFSHLLPFAMAYRLTGDSQWCDKGTGFYLHETHRFATAGVSEQAAYPGYSQGFNIPTTLLKACSDGGYFE